MQLHGGEVLAGDDCYAIVLAGAIRDLQVLVNAAIYRMDTLFYEMLIFSAVGGNVRVESFILGMGLDCNVQKNSTYFFCKRKDLEVSKRLGHGK